MVYINRNGMPMHPRNKYLKQETEEIQMNIPERCDIPLECRWDLTPLYENPAAWESDFEKIDDFVEKFYLYKGRLHESPEILCAAFGAQDELNLLLRRLNIYAGLCHDADVTNEETADRESRFFAKRASIAEKTSWFMPELLAVPAEQFEKFRKAPVLAPYQRTLEKTEQKRKHTLSESEERILGMSGAVFGHFSSVFGMLNDGDMNFPEITGEQGNRIRIGNDNYAKLLACTDAGVREAAFNGYLGTYGKLSNTIAAILDGSVKSEVLNAKIRGFRSAQEAGLYQNEIPVEVYDNLITEVHNNLSLRYRYFKIRAKAMGVEKLNMYDLQNPVIPPRSDKYTWDDAVRLVKEAMLPMGGTYCRILDRAFAERWVDYMPNRGKRSGAYSTRVYRTPGYVLLSYAENMKSVFLLAHELGHSMHTFFSEEEQSFRNSAYNMFAAEIASKTSELLLFYSMKKNMTSGEDKACLLQYLLSVSLGEVFHQTMLAEFESDIYSWSEQGIPLTAEKLCSHYEKLVRIYHGDAVNANKNIRYEWAKIPHFYNAFYVYQYATGVSAASVFAQDILAGKTERYMDFLRAGDSRNIIDVLKDAGVDFTTADPVRRCMNLFEDTVSELESYLA